MKTERISIGEVELSYNEARGNGRPLVLLHGLTGHRDDFRERMPDLADAGRVLAPDLRGHGDFTQTGRAETFSFEQLVADLAALLDAWGVARCDLLGHSFGGMLALRFALAHPERVASLILMDTAPFAPDGYSLEMFEKAGAIARGRGMAFLQELVEKAAHNAADVSAADAHTARWADRYWPHHRRRYRAMDPEGYATLALLMMKQTPVVDRLAEIRCPTSVLVGAEDTEFLRGADALAAGIEHAVRVTLPDAGHHPHMENPAAWLAAIRDHLRRTRGTEGDASGLAAPIS
jgi:pimeloyl-ACP methyl ester carboxylesterase